MCGENTDGRVCVKRAGRDGSRGAGKWMRGRHGHCATVGSTNERLVAAFYHPARLAELPRVLTELRRLIDADDRPGLARACLSAAETLQ